MSDFTFKLNPRGIAECAVGPEVTAAVAAEAEKARVIAEGLSTDFVITGDYINSFETSVEIMDLPAAGTSPSHPAAVGILKNTAARVTKTGGLDYYAVAVEYGHEGRSDAPTRRAHRVFGRTLAALGGS